MEFTTLTCSVEGPTSSDPVSDSAYEQGSSEQLVCSDYKGGWVVVVVAVVAVAAT